MRSWPAIGQVLPCFLYCWKLLCFLLLVLFLKPHCNIYANPCRFGAGLVLFFKAKAKRLFSFCQIDLEKLKQFWRKSLKRLSEKRLLKVWELLSLKKAQTSKAESKQARRKKRKCGQTLESLCASWWFFGGLLSRAFKRFPDVLIVTVFPLSTFMLFAHPRLTSHYPFVAYPVCKSETSKMIPFIYWMRQMTPFFQVKYLCFESSYQDSLSWHFPNFASIWMLNEWRLSQHISSN